MTTKRARMSSPRLVLQPPAVDRVVPAHRAHLGGEDRAVVQPEVLPDVAAVLEDLGAVGVLLARHEVELFEHRDVAVCVVVALDPGEPVPVPDAAEVAAHLDDVDVVDAGLLQVGARQQPGDTAAEDRHLDVLVDRRARCHRGVRVDLCELREIACEFQVLRRPFRAQALVALVGVLLPQRVDVDVFGGVGGPAGVEDRH